MHTVVHARHRRAKCNAVFQVMHICAAAGIVALALVAGIKLISI